MNFFEHQRLARRNSRRLLLMFALAVIIIVGVMTAVGWNLGRWMMEINNRDRIGTVVYQMDLGLLFGFWVGATTFVVITVASLVRIFQLRGGGDVVAEEMGGTAVPEDTKDPDLRRLRNVTEEIAIASGVPVPHLYVLEHEPGINAFAAGYSAADAAVAVTRGTLDQLNRDELQAVVAHEFSHILNGDMRLNIRLIGVIYGILVINLLGWKMLDGFRVISVVRDVDVYRNATSDDSTPITSGQIRIFLLVLGITCIIVGSIGALLGRLIKAAISRQREYLADASAVQFTRQKHPLANALKKIGGLDTGSTLRNRAVAQEVSHMLFGSGWSMTNWLSTHPPLIERIQRLEPRFKQQRLEELRQQWRAQPPNGLAEDRALGLAKPNDAVPPPPLPSPVEFFEPSATAAPTFPKKKPPPLPPLAEMKVFKPSPVASKPAVVTAPSPPPVLPQQSTARRIEAPSQADYQQARELFAQLPPALLDAAHHRDQTRPLLLALLTLDSSSTTAQHQIIETHLGMKIAWQVRDLSAALLSGLHLGLRLPLAELAFPALRWLPAAQLQVFSRCIMEVIQVNQQVSLFEYCFSHLLQVQIQAVIAPSQQKLFGKRKLPQAKPELATLFRVIAWAGHPDDPAGAQRAAVLGWNVLFPHEHLIYEAPRRGPVALDPVWSKLDELEPISKQLLIEAITATVHSDQQVTVAEAELLHTLCGVLHCPLPAQLRLVR